MKLIKKKFRKKLADKGLLCSISEAKREITIKKNKRKSHGNSLTIGMKETKEGMTMHRWQYYSGGWEYIEDAMWYWEEVAKEKGKTYIRLLDLKEANLGLHHKLKELGYCPIGELDSEHDLTDLFGSNNSKRYMKELKPGILSHYSKIKEAMEKGLETIAERDKTFEYSLRKPEKFSGFGYYYKGKKGYIDIDIEDTIILKEVSLGIEETAHVYEEIEAKIEKMLDGVWKKTRAKIVFDPPKKHLEAFLRVMKVYDYKSVKMKTIQTELRSFYEPDEIENMAVEFLKRVNEDGYYKSSIIRLMNGVAIVKFEDAYIVSENRYTERVFVGKREEALRVFEEMIVEQTKKQIKDVIDFI